MANGLRPRGAPSVPIWNVPGHSRHSLTRRAASLALRGGIDEARPDQELAHRTTVGPRRAASSSPFSSAPPSLLSSLPMPPSPSCRLSTSPYLPGAWPSPMRDHDDGQDADVSSLSSHGSLSAARRDSKARRRWTYTGPRRVHGYSSTPSLRFSDSAGGSASNEIKMSPLTQHTVRAYMRVYYEHNLTASYRAGIHCAFESTEHPGPRGLAHSAWGKRLPPA